jgi:hypothetical protein
MRSCCQCGLMIFDVNGPARSRPRVSEPTPLLPVQHSHKSFFSQHIPKLYLPPSSRKFNFAASKKAGRNPILTVSASVSFYLGLLLIKKAISVRTDFASHFLACVRRHK